MKSHKRHWLRPLLILLACVGMLAAVLFPYAQSVMHPVKYIKSDTNTLTVTDIYLSQGEVAEDVYEIPRGAKVTVKEKGEQTSKVLYDGMLLSVPNENLADSRTECVEFEYVYPRRMVNLRLEREGKLSDVVVQKGEAVKVVSALASDLDPETGVISWFEVEKDGEIYYLSGTNVEMSEEAALKNYGTDLQYTAVYDSLFGEGYSQSAYIDQIDFKGVPKPNWSDNPLPDDVQAVHITLENLIKYKDDLIQLKNETGLNALVVALKGKDGIVWYDSDVPEQYFNDTSEVLSNTLLTKSELQDLFSQLKQAGFYIIGRMETFADAALASDHPEWAITNTDGTLAVYSEDYWTSAYCRDVWEYNGALAKEFAELGVNEVQLDFVRFPDGATQDEADGLLDFHNTYNESKVSAIQGFVYYITEELAPYHVYTAVDMYAGPVMDHYDYDIGHFFPALAAAADVVDPMVYLDSFSFSVYGFDDLDNQEREILEAFTNNVNKMLETVPYPAQLRMWLQGYNNTTPERVAREIKGIMDAGQSGYLLWTDQGSLDALEYLRDGLIESGS